MKVAVIGAGVNGLACAVKIKEKYKDFQVVVISSEFSPNTTGDGSGGLWFPYLCGDTPYKLIEKWGGETYRFLHELWNIGSHSVCLIPIYNLYRDKNKFCKPDWVNAVYGYQELNSKQLGYYSQRFSTKYTAGQTFITFTAYPPIEDYVKAQWITESIIDECGGNYIIPNAEICVLGGTHQDSYSTEIDPADTDFIMKGCQQIIPGLQYAEVVTHWAGLRPGRDTIRLEPEEKDGKLYIHNYGHGGSGFTLFWGCSSEVLQILDTYVNKKHKLYPNSKL